MNPWKQLQSLIAQPPKQVGIIAAHNADGTSTVILTGGGQIRVNGQDNAVNARVFIRNHEVVGSAPALPSETIDI